MTKKVLDLHIEDLLQQIESADRRINMWSQGDVDGVAMSMIQQYSIMKAEFVERLNALRKEALKLERTPVAKKTYAYEAIPLSIAHEPTLAYGEKSNIDVDYKIKK
jgi:hypothetical protein